MAEPSQGQIRQWLSNLRHPEPYLRVNAVQNLARLGTTTAEIVEAIKVVAGSDSDVAVRRVAQQALVELHVEQPGVPTAASRRSASPWQKRFDRGSRWGTLAGFVAWYAINGLLWIGLGRSYYSVLNNALLFPANLAALVIFGYALPRVGFGILLAVTLNFVVALVLGLALNGFCLIPFFSTLN